MSSCLQDFFLHAELHCKTKSQTGVAVQLLTRACGALSKSIGLGSFQTGHWAFFINDNKTALLHVLMFRSDCFVPCSQQESPREVQRPVKTEKEGGKACLGAIWGRGSRDTSFSLVAFHPSACSPWQQSVYALYNDRLLERNAVRQLQRTSPAPPLEFAPLSREVAQPLHIERPAVKLPKVKKLNDKRTLHAVYRRLLTPSVPCRINDHSRTEFKLCRWVLYISLRLKRENYRPEW